MMEPPQAAALFPTLTPPRGESVQRREPSALSRNPDTIEGESIDEVGRRGGLFLQHFPPPTPPKGESDQTACFT